MSSLTAILDGMADALNDVMGPDVLGEDAVQVVGRMNLDPQSPTSIDIYPADPFRGEESTGFGERAGELVFTVRARVTTSDTDAAQNKLLALLDDEDDLCVAAALEADPTLDGLVSQLHVDGDTGYRVFEDPPGAMLGVAWRVRVINRPSEVERVSTQKLRILGPFPFAFDDPGLEDGIEFYTPTVGDVLCGFAFYADEKWDGTTPKGDFGPFLNETQGFFALTGVNANGYPLSNNAPSFPFDTLGQGSSGIGEYGFILPVLDAEPWKIVVSQDGLVGGASPGSTQGSAVLYLLIGTPTLP